MSYPAIVRTQQILKNIACAADASNLIQSQLAIFEIYKGILALGTGYVDAANAAVSSPVAPWVLTGSSDGTTSGIDATNRLTASNKFIWAGAGTNHTWWVWYNATLGVYLLFDCLNATSSNMTVKASTTAFSAAAGGTNGSTTTAPTAAISFTLLSDAAWGASGSNATASKLHIWISADGKSTRVVMCRASHTTAHWHFELPEQPITGWTHPDFLQIKGTGTAAPGTDVTTFANEYGSSPSALGFANALTSISLHQSCESVNAGAIAAVQTTSGSFSAGFPFLGIGLWSNTVGSLERVGYLADIYWAITATATGQGSPGDEQGNAALRNQYVKLGPWMYVWPIGVVPAIA